MDGTRSSYGADSAGLICGYLLDPLGNREIDTMEAAAWLAEQRATPARGADAAFCWLHFNLAHTGAMPWLAEHADLSSEFFELVRDGMHSTRIERTEQALVAVVNDAHFDFNFEPADISTLWISVERHLVVTARQQPLRAVDKLREAVKAGQPLRSAAELFEHLLRAQADVLVEIVRGATERVDAIEDQLLTRRLEHRRARLGALRLLLVRLQRLLAPEPASLFRLLQHPPRWMGETDVQELRQANEEFSLVLRDMSTLEERIKLLKEEIAAEVGESNNRSLFVLTMVTVLALPINILAGLFGMNVGGIPLNQHPNGFWIIVAIVVSFTVLAAWLTLRRRDQR